MEDRFLEIDPSPLPICAVVAVLAHAIVLFGWSRVIMEESAYGIGNHHVSSTLEIVSAPSGIEPAITPPSLPVAPPKPLESSFKKKVVKKQTVTEPPQPATAPALSQDAQSGPSQSSSTSSGAGGAGIVTSGGTSAEPDYLRNPPPKYPREARLNREEGMVLLKVQISSSGQVESLSLKRSSGFSRLDDSALSAVKNWKFKPAVLAGLPVASEVEVPIRFTLRNER